MSRFRDTEGQRLYYMHVVASYTDALAQPFASALEAARRLEAAFEPAEVQCRVRGCDFDPAEWDAARSASGATEWRRKAGGAAELSEAVTGAQERALDRVTLLRPNRGAASPKLDYDWRVHYSAPSGPGEVQHDAGVVVSVRMNRFPTHRAALKVVRDLAMDLMAGCLRAGTCFYALIDVAAMRETGAHGLYCPDDAAAVESESLVRLTERQVWSDLGMARRGRVRGVFWGNYLRAELVAELGGKDSFRERYLSVAKANLLLHSELVSEPECGGLFVRISHDPRDCDWLGNIGKATAAWLHRELRQAKLLI